MDFEELYNKYFKDVYKYVFSLCKNQSIAEEITQDTFFKALNAIDSFNGKCSIYVWLCQIAKNSFFTYIKKEKKNELLNADFDIASSDNIEDSYLNKETEFEIHKCLHELDEPYKEVFSLRVLGEMSFAQIAELFGKSESWARVTYHRAKIKIKEKLA